MKQEESSGNVVGIDPHKRTLSATVMDARGGVVATAHFKVSGPGHRKLQVWANGFGPVVRWGVEGAGGLGRHTAMFLARQGYDVRDVCPTRTAERTRRRRRQGKSDALDAQRIARETLDDPGLPQAFKRAPGDVGPDETHELLTLWHNARISLKKSRQHLLNEAEALLVALPDELRDSLPDRRAVRPRLAALADRDRTAGWDAATAVRLGLLDEYRERIGALDRRERDIVPELDRLLARAGTTLGELVGLATRSVVELLVEVGDPRRFTEGGFGLFNGTAPLLASSGEGPDDPDRHRLNLGGNRRVNAVLHRMAVTQLRCEPRAQKIYADARARGHTKKEAMRVLKRNLSNVVYRRMIRDVSAHQRAHSGHPNAA